MCENAVNVVLMSIGTISPPPQSLTLFPDPRVQVHKLQSLGVTGDLLMTFFDKQGTFVKTDFTKRTIRVDFDLIKKAPLAVGVSGGPDKVQSIAGALQTGVINVLVTDESTARAVVSGRYWGWHLVASTSGGRRADLSAGPELSKPDQAMQEAAG